MLPRRHLVRFTHPTRPDRDLAHNTNCVTPNEFKKERGYTAHDQPGELFNVRDDPSQRHNLYGERPEVVRERKALLERYKREGRSTPGLPRKNDVPIGSSP